MNRAPSRLLAAGALLAAVAVLATASVAGPDDRDGTAARFNRLYTEFDRVFSHQPNAFLVEAVRDVPPGTALDVAMGQGRNALFLAREGWQVTGFDIAEEGLKIARTEAQRQGVRIDAVSQGYEEFDFGRERWDLVVLSYAWVPLVEDAFVGSATRSDPAASSSSSIRWSRPRMPTRIRATPPRARSTPSRGPTRTASSSSSTRTPRTSATGSERPRTG
jgi:hypothetical protein